MKGWTLESWLLLIYFDYLMWADGFSSVQEVVRSEQVQPEQDLKVTAPCLSRAMDLACVLYPKRVLCLQRSAATAILLRRHGWTAELVIGAQMLPFMSHAWVEVHGEIVNDKLYMTEIFQVLDRC